MRNSKQWLSFKGVRSDDLGAYPADFPRRITGAPRVSAHHVPGRDGSLIHFDNAQSEFDLTRSLRVPADKLSDVQNWLNGSGELILSHRPDAAYDACILKNVEFRQILPGEDGLWECSVPFTCQPHPRMLPEAQEISFTAPGEIPTPANALGLPRVKIEGSGSFSLTIGHQTLLFSGVAGGIIVDSELGDALTPDGAALANDQVSGPLFTLGEGPNTISWAGGSEDEAGEVQRVTILPRWRYIT